MSGTPTKSEHLYNLRDPRTLYLSKHKERPLSEVERRMDELTEALISADYSYDFVAE